MWFLCLKFIVKHLSLSLSAKGSLHTESGTFTTLELPLQMKCDFIIFSTIIRKMCTFEAQDTIENI